MKRVASIRLMLSIALLVLVGAPLGARAAVSHVATAPDALEAVTTPHIHHHRQHRTHHAAKAETADMRATGSARPEHRHGGSTSHHRATVPSYGQSQPTHRHPRADGRGLAAVQEVTTTDGRDAAMLRSRSPRATPVNERRVGSGRAPPRGAPTDDSEIPHAPPRLRIPAPSPAPQFDPAPPAIAQHLRARSAAPCRPRIGAPRPSRATFVHSHRHRRRRSARTPDRTAAWRRIPWFPRGRSRTASPSTVPRAR